VAVICTNPTVAALAAKAATTTIPIVFQMGSDPVETGLVASLNRPGGNLTGFVASAPETTAKRFQIMKEVKPDFRRATVLWNSTSSSARLEWSVAREFATANDIAVILHDAHDVDQLRSELASVAQSASEVLVVLNDPFMFTHRKSIVESAGKSRLPANYGFREYVDDGGLISYGPSISDGYRRAALYVDKILKGAKPADLPVVLPTKIELVINLKTAKALGLEIPPTLLATADEVIE
jgi:putative ABC transport system substrate-binding protein